MIKPRYYFSILLITILSACATMPSPAGKWTAAMDTPQGPFTLGYDFMVDGSELTGTVSNDFTGATPISDGIVKGKDLSFKVRVEGGPGGPMTVIYNGMLENDQINFNVTFEGTPPPGAPDKMELTAKRVPE